MMLHLFGAKIVPKKQVSIAPTKIGGIGHKEATQVRYRLGSNIPIPKILFYLTLYVPSHVLLKGASHFALKLVSFLKK